MLAECSPAVVPTTALLPPVDVLLLLFAPSAPPSNIVTVRADLAGFDGEAVAEEEEVGELFIRVAVVVVVVVAYRDDGDDIFIVADRSIGMPAALSPKGDV